MSGTVIMNLSFQVRMREGRVDRKTGSGQCTGCLTRYSGTMNGHSAVTPEPATPAYVPSLTHSPATAYSTFGCLVFDYTQAGSVIWSRILLCPPYNRLNSRPKVDFVTPIIF